MFGRPIQPPAEAEALDLETAEPLVRLHRRIGSSQGPLFPMLSMRQARGLQSRGFIEIIPGADEGFITAAGLEAMPSALKLVASAAPVRVLG